MLRLPQLTIAVLLFATIAAAQSCPAREDNFAEAEKPRTAHGKISVHHDLRDWIEFKPDHRVCGEASLQLTFQEQADFRRAQSFNRCGATVVGKIYEGSTGYYSRALAVDVTRLTPDPSCRSSRVPPDFEHVRLPSRINNYYAEITVDYAHLPVRVAVWSNQAKQKRLLPWQGYIRRSFSGAPDVLWIRCAEGFEPTEASQDPPGEIINDGGMVGPELQMDRVTAVKLTCKRSGVPTPSGPR